MPIYEYEPCDRECFMCEGKLQLMQSISEHALSLCPFCGMEIKKVVSRATFKLQKHSGPEDAGKKGFSTYKKSEKGVWEKVGGEGADYLVGSKEDVAAVEAEKQKPAKKFDLDKS